MEMFEAFRLFFVKALDFKGRSSRREFWLGILPNAIIMIILIALLLYSLLGFSKPINAFSIIMIVSFALFCIVEIVPSISLIFRRMHDIGKSGCYIWVLFIPIAGFFWYIFLVTRKSNYYNN